MISVPQLDLIAVGDFLLYLPLEGVEGYVSLQAQSAINTCGKCQARFAVFWKRAVNTEGLE